MSPPKVGSLVYATVQGLGVLAKQFFDNKIVDSVFVLEHHCRANHHDAWYPGQSHAPSRLVARGLPAAHDFIRSLDAVLFFETPFDWSLIRTARESGVRSFLMTMHECTPTELPEKPDELLCPSLLDQQCFPGGRLVQVPVVDPMQYGRQRYQPVKTFVHNAGNGGLRGRNGTAEFLEALFLLSLKRQPKDVLKFILRSQVPLAENVLRDVRDRLADDVRLDLGRTLSRWDLWAEGDAFVFPEKFNGLSLPIQEAYASGMLVLATDRNPNNLWLPRECLIPTTGSRRARVGPGYREFDEALIAPSDIAAKMREVATWPGERVAALSEQGMLWGQRHSWHALQDEWLRIVGKESA